MERMEMTVDLARLAVNTIKMLSVDGVEKAKSGHPGMPMGAADYAFILWSRYLRFNPADPAWPDRDRFVLSAGHGSMLLYSLLHLSGYDVSLDDLKAFRQWGSRTPGHPERNCLPGVEVTTGPLGQGVGNAVGLALASRMLAARVNSDRFSLITHRVYGICSDGDLMEGVASEAASLAGHLGLGNLIFIYDDNHISIDGPTEITFSEDVGRRFEAYGWHVQRIDGHDHAAITRALDAARAEESRPSIILARTHIANGAPTKHDTAGAHGAPLGAAEAAATRKALGWPEEPAFHVPEEVRRLFADRVEVLRREYDAWQSLRADCARTEPQQAATLKAYLDRTVPADLGRRLLDAAPKEAGATRGHSGKLFQLIGELVPSFAGGAADLVESTKTAIKASKEIRKQDYSGRNIAFGIREHAMGAVVNGLACSGAFIPYGSTFLIFADYMRPSMRLSALSDLQVLYIFTHDSVFLGEDGPTHQPIEHLASLRLIPNMHVVRPADGPETALAYAHAFARRHGPTTIALTRQDTPALPHNDSLIQDFFKGGYILQEASSGRPRAVLVASGSEVGFCMEARGILEEAGIPARVVSMPCVELFEQQDASWRRRVIPADDAAVQVAVVEAGAPHMWPRVAGSRALVIGLERFGASSPWKRIADELGFTGPKIAAKVRQALESR